MGGMQDIPIVSFAAPDAWREWLDANHAASGAVWLRIAKKDAPTSSVSYAEALDVALCYGWIDGKKIKGDEHSWLQSFGPRRPNGLWSKINRDKVEALIASGAMRPAGLAAIDHAKANGRWDAAYDSQANATVPDDLQLALDAEPAAAVHFVTISGQNRYAILFRIQTAKKPETRASRIAQFVAMLARGETIH